MGDGGIARDPGSLLEWWMVIYFGCSKGSTEFGRRRKRMRKKGLADASGLVWSAPALSKLQRSMSALGSASQRLRPVNLQ